MEVGGLERVVSTLCTALDRRRFDPVVLCMRGAGRLAADLQAKGIPVHVLDRDITRRDLSAFKQVRRILKELDVDVIHTHNTEPFVQGALACLTLPRVRIVHTDHARPFPDKRRWMLAENLASRRAKWVVGVSDHTTNNLQRYERIPSSKLVTVPNGIDPEPYRELISQEEARSALCLPSGVPVLGAILARFNEQKGLDTLVEGFHRVHAQRPDAILAIVGERDGKDRVEAHVASLGLEGNVRFLGLRTDVPKVLPAFDLYVMSSIWEGLPMVLLEAMAAGLPIVSTDVGGVSTAVRHTENGLLVPARDPAGLAEAILALVNDGPRRAQMSAAALRRFSENFTAGHMARAYEGLYVGTTAP